MAQLEQTGEAGCAFAGTGVDRDRAEGPIHPEAQHASDWKEVVCDMTTRMDSARDTLLIEHTPIDTLDFASRVSGLGSNMGMDATNKWPGETQREWGRTMAMDADVAARMQALGDALGL